MKLPKWLRLNRSAAIREIYREVRLKRGAKFYTESTDPYGLTLCVSELERRVWIYRNIPLTIHVSTRKPEPSIARDCLTLLMTREVRGCRTFGDVNGVPVGLLSYTWLWIDRNFPGDIDKLYVWFTQNGRLAARRR